MGGEIHDVFENCGCKMLGYTNQNGYEHEASKAIRGDKFCGLLCDMMNQEDLTEGRIQNWFVQLKEEGLLNRGDNIASEEVSVQPTNDNTVSTPSLQNDNGNIFASSNDFDEKMLADNSKLLDQNIAMASHDNPLGF